MAAQDGLDILFSSSHSQQTFKFLELPNELLAQLESDDPPTLKFETEPSSSLALLTTPSGLKYRVQQKNSSNHMLILQPTTTRSSLLNITPESEESAITTISTIQDTLELLPYVVEGVKEKKVNKWHEKFAKTRKK